MQIVSYLFLASTYAVKKRKTILLFSFISLSANGVAYSLLGAWTGFAMACIAIIRNIIFTIQNRKGRAEEGITKIDWLILLFFVLIIIISTVFTYEKWFSVFSALGTLIYTFSIWQKNTLIYKYLCIPTGIFYILYNLFINSLFGIIMEGSLLLWGIIEIILYYVKISKAQKKENIVNVKLQ